MQQVAVRCQSKNIKWNRSMVGVVSFALMIDRTNYIRTNVLFQGYVRLRQFLGRALWLAQARVPSAAARTGQVAGAAGVKNRSLGNYKYFKLILAWEPSFASKHPLLKSTHSSQNVIANLRIFPRFSRVSQSKFDAKVKRFKSYDWTNKQSEIATVQICEQ